MKWLAACVFAATVTCVLSATQKISLFAMQGSRWGCRQPDHSVGGLPIHACVCRGCLGVREVGLNVVGICHRVDFVDSK